MTMAGEGSLNYQGDANLAASGSNPLTTVLAGLSGGKVANGKMTFPFTVVGLSPSPSSSRKALRDRAEHPRAAPRNLSTWCADSPGC